MRPRWLRIGMVHYANTLQYRRTRVLMDALVLMSGGIDSAACAHFFQQRGDNVKGVFVDYGQMAANAERKAVARISKHFGIPFSALSFKGNYSYGVGEVVGRNAFLIFAALLGARPTSGVITLGIHAGTPYYDCGSDFGKHVDHLVQSYSVGRIRLHCPFLMSPKAFIYDYARKAELPLQLTYSCELGTVPPCEQCPSCKERGAIQAS